ncbi:MAG: hypothetical protein NWE92_08010 [Candidatus Bathyarchaeota archaeon]|nr:hypothetical protein [Candidatus Bathyarchaeota archaeon]
MPHPNRRRNTKQTQKTNATYGYLVASRKPPNPHKETNKASRGATIM